MGMAGIIQFYMKLVKPQSGDFDLDAVRSQLGDDWPGVNREIVANLSSDVALVNSVAHYIVNSGGKRLRPLLVLLAARACGYTGDRHVPAAVIIEFIHTATLLHDDVVDDSNLRRGQDTANSVFGNQASVLVGDFLYSRSFQLMVKVGQMRIMDVLADATNTIAEGEVLQLLNMHDPDVVVEDYLRVIRYKTAKLFEASARLGAILGGANAELEEACASYGRSVGTGFQLVDDLLDYDGQSTELGKNVGDDLREGKPTLPLLVAMARGSDAERTLIRRAIEHGEVERLTEIVDIVRRTGALEATREAAESEADNARASVQALPAGHARDALLELCDRSIRRSF
jgi:octaprenyl-diphosphate synthase